MDKITKYAGSLGQAITDKAAIEAAKAEIKVLRTQANKGNVAAAKQLAALEQALKDGKIRGTK
jgi:3-oxoacyl-[acyl-carrier-protein] synthase III